MAFCDGGELVLWSLSYCWSQGELLPPLLNPSLPLPAPPGGGWTRWAAQAVLEGLSDKPAITHGLPHGACHNTQAATRYLPPVGPGCLHTFLMSATNKPLIYRLESCAWRRTVVTVLGIRAAHQAERLIGRSKCGSLITACLHPVIGCRRRQWSVDGTAACWW